MTINPLMDALIVVLILIILVVVVLRLRNKTLMIWNEVTKLEVTFHTKLFESLHVFLAHQATFEHHDHDNVFKALSSYKEQEIRALTLRERQYIFKSLQTLYLCLDETSSPTQKTLKHQFEALQKCRLKFNSKVLYYNQFIGKFPMRMLAGKMQFKEKEYFG